MKDQTHIIWIKICDCTLANVGLAPVAGLNENINLVSIKDKTLALNHQCDGISRYKDHLLTQTDKNRIRVEV